MPAASRVMVTGASGLLGTWLRRTAPPATDLVPVVHRRRTGDPAEVVVDLRDARGTVAAVQAVRPDLVVHAAYAKDEASIVAATRHLAEGARAAGAAVVHISTDSVFRGDGRPRSESAAPDPISDYGRWKAEAEAVVRCDPVAAIVRLPLVISVEPPDHVATAITEGATTGRATTWFTDEVRRPAMASELAAAIWRIAALHDPDRAGTWHLSGPERLSRHELARRVVAALDLPADAILAATAPPDDVRPRDLHLTDERARQRIGWAPSAVLL